MNLRFLRSARVLPEDPKGVKVKVHTTIGLLERRFYRNTFYQEVYDWLGCYKDLPLYFVFVGQTQNGSDLCYPKDKVAQDGEVLKLMEKDEEEMKTMISSTEVTFCGTFPQLPDLNSTAESPGTDAGLRKDEKKRVSEEKADLETKDTKRATQIKTNIVTDGSTSQLSQNDGGTSKRRKRRRNKEKERKKQITTENTE